MNSQVHSAWRPAPAALAPATPAPVAALASHPGGGPAGAALASPSLRASRATVSPPLSPRLASCCNIVMGLVMGYMLIISL